MKHTRGVWFAPESDPDEGTVGHLIRGAVGALPDMTHARVISRLPNGTVFTEEGMLRIGTPDRLTLIPAPSGDDQMTGWPRRIPWTNIVSVEVS